MPDADKQTSDSKPDSNKGKDWELVAEGDWLAGQRFIIKHHAVLGRDSSCDITIPGTHLSRRHAELAVSDRHLLINDLNSSNGTFVNDKRVNKGELSHGDRVRFDVLEFRIEGPRPADPAETSNANRQSKPGKKNSANNQTERTPQWKTRPTGVGNRNKTIAMSAVEKATRSIELLLWGIVGIAAIGGVVYLITHL